MNMLPHLDKLAASGLSSLKIEGRMKNEYYIATVVGAYRRGLDAIRDGLWNDELRQELTDELNKVSHRAYDTGFYFGAPERPGGNEGNTQTMELTARVLACENGRAKIINIASSAGFLPQPGFACYAASKSYVISFSRAMSAELKAKGIDVMAVCPGPVATDFQRRATEGKEADFTDWRKNFVIDPVKLAKKSLRASAKGRKMLVYPFSQKLLHLASKIVPTSWILAFMGNGANE